MTEVGAASIVAVAGSVCGDPKRLEELDEQHADHRLAIENKRPRFDDEAKKQADADVTKPEREDVMGKENPEFPNESRNWRGYARVPTGGGLQYLFNPLGTLSWAGYNRREHFFIAGKSEKWMPCIGAMKKCAECHHTYPPVCEFCANCGMQLPGLQEMLPSKRCEACNLTYVAAFNHCSKCGVGLTSFA